MAFDISKYAETVKPAPQAETVRDIEAVTGEIIHLKQELARNIVDIGLRLIEAKGMLSHGEWLPWLDERVHFSEKSAQNYMRVAREFPNPQLVADLGVRKALALLELPPSERESFAEENNVIDMTSRELEKAIRERDEARRAAEAAQADARTAEESRAKMEADMKALEEIHRAAQEGEVQAREALEKAQKELRELRERPVEVAVEVDREAVEKARAEAVAEMQGKVDAAERARNETEEKRQEAENALLKAVKELDAAKKEAGDNHNVSLIDQILSVHSLAYSQINRLHGLLMKARGRNCKTDADQAERSLLDLAVYARKCVE